VHEADHVDEADDHDGQDGEGRHQVADEDGSRDEHAQGRKAQVAKELLRDDLISFPTFLNFFIVSMFLKYSHLNYETNYTKKTF